MLRCLRGCWTTLQRPPLNSASTLRARSRRATTHNNRETEAPLKSEVEEGVQQADQTKSQLLEWLRDIQSRSTGGRYRRHSRMVASLVRDLDESDEHGAQRALFGTTWFLWWQRAQSRIGLAPVPAQTETPQLEYTTRRPAASSTGARALAESPSCQPQMIDIQKAIERCDRTRAGFLGAVRFLQALPQFLGTGPSAGCLADLIRLCASMRSVTYLRFSDQIMRMMSVAITEAAESGSFADLEQTFLEARYVAFRYVIELNVTKYSGQDRRFADERLLYWFHWSIQEILLRFQPLVKSRHGAASRMAPLANPDTEQALSSSETRSKGESNVFRSKRQTATESDDAACPGPATPDTVLSATSSEPFAESKHVFQLPVVLVRPTQTSAPLKEIRVPSVALIRSLLRRCAASGLIAEALEALACARALGYRLRSSDLALVFDAAAEAARRQCRASTSVPTTLATRPDVGCSLDRIVLPPVDHDMIFHIFQCLLGATSCRISCDVLTAMARAIRVAPPAEQRAERAMSILKELRRRSIRPSSALLQQLILACVSGGDIRRALAIHIHMAERNMPLSVSVANALITLCLNKEHTGTARAILEDLASRSDVNQINAETLSLLVRYWAQVGNEQQARMTMERIRNTGSGFKPTETAYVAMLELAAARGDVNAAMHWMQTLERDLEEEQQEQAAVETNPSLTRSRMPSERAFCAIFQCLRKAAAADTAMGLLSAYAARYGYQPSPEVYQIVYETCMRGSRLDYMRRLREEIQQRGVTLPQLQALSFHHSIPSR
ncbi:hypothetical protein F1559_003307 [Cyanidiococcus yangmingshanensis]|uniref:Pentacotripeptide-repeat region of PRORP domain-containing protein n=1 Tax=Cyanidiococcus yangmingshanensis TaxID=2690220 RepID=A0A7J7IHN8_9RHOD|nr:hypothetical protein F1559_003307 [Cyanidiococcus yangmingshanensis]